MAGMEEVVMSRGPKRADARRNYEKLVTAAAAAFAEDGVAATLEDIARRAQVGIGTLYRHFPARQNLFESVYVNEVQTLCRTAGDLAEFGPWDALEAWLRRFVGYAATKRALAEELIASIGRDSEIFRSCRAAIYSAGGPMLLRAQQAGAARSDVNFDDVLRLIGGITMIHYTEPGQLDRVLGMALDGLHSRPDSPTV